MNALTGKPGTALTIVAPTLTGIANAGSGQHGHSHTGHQIRRDLYQYTRLLEARPLYGEVKVSNPVQECWGEPVYHRRREHSSGGGLLAGGRLTVLSDARSFIRPLMAMGARRIRSRVTRNTASPVIVSVIEMWWATTMSPVSILGVNTSWSCLTIRVST